MRLRIERHPEPTRLRWLGVFLITFFGSLVLCGLLLAAAGADLRAALSALIAGGFGTWRACAETFVRATPLIFTGLACAVAFRANAWNIGAEGQFYAGAIVAYWIYAQVWQWPAVVAMPAIVMAGMAGGALYAALAGFLKVRAAVDEVISTVMLNYIILYGLSMLLLNGPWTEAGGIYPQTARIAEPLQLPKLLEKSRLHAGLLLALAAAVCVHVLISRTSLGYEIRGMGSNARALLFKGTDTRRLFVVVMCLSGALAGLAGISEVYGIHHRLKDGISGGVGYAGIIVAILARHHPLGVIAAAVLFGGLVNGALFMQIKTGVPSAVAYAIEAIILLLMLAASQISRFRLVRVRHA
jgi:simple sugar transport system permease protein